MRTTQPKSVSLFTQMDAAKAFDFPKNYYSTSHDHFRIDLMQFHWAYLKIS